MAQFTNLDIEKNLQTYSHEIKCCHSQMIKEIH